MTDRDWGLRDCTVRFGAHAEAAALAGVSLAVPPGRVTAVVGGDGAGKTTLLRVLAGRVVPRPGSVEAPPLTEIGFMPSTSGVWGDLTVDENVAFVGRTYGMEPATLAARRKALLERAGLLVAADRLGRRLSGGMRQKLGFCLAMLHEPRLLVLDEPSTGVDPVSRVELWRMIAEAAAAGRAVVMSTTYLDEAERASSVLVLDAGRTLYQGEPAAIATAVTGTVVRGLAPPAAAPPAAALPPAGRAAAAAPEWPRARSWRRGRERRAWFPGTAPVGLGQVEETPDLEDAAVALSLAARSVGAASGSDDDGRGRSDDDGATTMTAEAIAVDGAVKRFGRLVAVDDVSLRVAPGEIVGLLGANGAGKTTLIKLVLGIAALDGGAVRVFGAPPSRATRRRLGYVPQGLGLYTDLTVRENIEFVAGAFEVAALPPEPDDIAAAGLRLVRAVGLGLQRRLAFFCALLHRPELLVLDEPTSGVDPLARARLWDTIHEQAEAGVAVLVTTHNMQEAEQCDHLVVMSGGRRVAAGSEADVVGDTSAVEIRAIDWSAAFDALSAAGLPVTLAGRAVRAAGVERSRVEAVLAGASVAADVRDVPATLEEAMVLVDRAVAAQPPMAGS